MDGWMDVCTKNVCIHECIHLCIDACKHIRTCACMYNCIRQRVYNVAGVLRGPVQVPDVMDMQLSCK